MAPRPPTLYQHIRQIVGRAIRETGQALDRLGIKTASLAVTKHDFYDDPVIYEDHLSRHRNVFPLLTSGKPIIHPQIAFIAPCSTLIGSVYVGKQSSIWYGAVLRGDTCENASAYLNKSSSSLYDNNNATPPPLTTGIQQQQQQPQQSQQLPTTETEESATSLPKATGDDEQQQFQFQVPPTPWALKESRYRDQTTHHGGAIFIGEQTNIQDSAIITATQNHCIIGNGVTIGHGAQLHSCTVHDYALIGMGSILLPGVIVETEAMIGAGAIIPENTIVRAGELWVGQNPVAHKIRDLTPQQRQKLHYQSSEYVHVASMHHPVMELGGNVDPITKTNVIMVPVVATDELDGNELMEALESTSQQPQQQNSTIADEMNVMGAVGTATPETLQQQQQQQHLSSGTMKSHATDGTLSNQPYDNETIRQRDEEDDDRIKASSSGR